MIKITLGILCLTSFVFADKIAFTSAACPETETFQKLNVKTKNALEANQILVNNNCEVLEVSDKINVVNQMEGDYFEIFIEKLGKNMYIKKGSVILEQPAKTNPLNRKF